jgi:hypothetical protein
VRRQDEQSGHLFRYLSQQRVPADHPLRAIRAMTDETLRRLSRRCELLYATTGRPSILREHLRRALESGVDPDPSARKDISVIARNGMLADRCNR